MKVDTNREKIDTILQRGVVDSVAPSTDALVSKLMSGQRLSFYLGIDITGNAIHLGHAGNLLLMEDFRNLGHEVIILLGDFTARIGDPTGKEKTRIERTEKEIEDNISHYKDQISRVVSFSGENSAVIRRNSEWLSKLSLSEIMGLARNFTVQQMIERDMFNQRIRDGSPIFLHEFLYPILQGYDSVALETDVEVGGTDQLFNMMAGRTLVERVCAKEKYVISTKLLEDERGVLMSKSSGTGIFLDGSSEQIFGQIMAQDDNMVKPLLVHCTRALIEDIEQIYKKVKGGGEGARDAKLEAAEIIVGTFFSKEDAEKARQNFVSTFSKGDLSDIQEIKLPYTKEKLFIVLVDARLADSNTEAKRLIEEGAVEVDGETIKDPYKEIEFSGQTVRVGKHRFARIIT